MTEAPEAVAVACLVTEALDALSVAHTIGGSIASFVAGEPRSTVDLDILGIVRVQGTQLDRTYLARHAPRWASPTCSPERSTRTGMLGCVAGRSGHRPRVRVVVPPPLAAHRSSSRQAWRPRRPAQNTVVMRHKVLDNTPVRGGAA